MATDETTEDALQDTDDVVGRIEEVVINRREFLIGALVGGIGVGGALGANSFAKGTRLERLATLASGRVAAPQTTYHLPAIGSDDEGLIIDFTMSIEDGAGDVYVNLDNVEVRHDIQLALREAAATATSVTDTTLDERDVFVSFDPPGSERLALRGKSWEAGLTVALIGLITRRQPSPRALVTGVVGTNGELLPVGNIEAKAIAARRFGADLFLVSPEQDASISGIDVKAVDDITSVARHVLQ